MGEISVKHHEKLQARPIMDEERRNAIEKLEKIIEGRTIKETQKKDLASLMTRCEIEEAVKSAANGISPGIDGVMLFLFIVLIT